MISILVFVSSLILAKVFLWPHLAKYQPAEGSSWKTLIWNDAPRFLVGIGKIAFVIVGAILIAGVLGGVVDSFNNASVFKLVVIAGLLAVCFSALDSVLKSRCHGNERILLWGFYGMAAVMLAHSKVPYLTLAPNTFVFGVGVYLVAMIALWALCYWPKMQTFAALPTGFAIAVAVISYDRYLNTGEFLFDFSRPDWVERIWPFAMFCIAIGVLMLVFYKKIEWRRRWAYPVLYLLFIGFFVKSGAVIFLLSTDEISARRISSAMEYNRVVELSTDLRLTATEKDLGVEYFRDQMGDLRAKLEANDPSVNPQDALAIAEANLGIIQVAEQRRQEIWDKRPEKIYLDHILWSRFKGAWQEYAAPHIRKMMS